MDDTIETTIAMPKTLFDAAQTIAQQMNIAHGQVFEMAIAQFISDYQTTPPDDTQKPIYQGDIYWLKADNPLESQADVPHPYVVIQENVLNNSRIQTVVVCALTSNLKKASMPGNVLLNVGEADLPRQSVIEVSKVSTIPKTQLGDPIGRLSEGRIAQIFAGMRFVQTSFLRR